MRRKEVGQGWVGWMGQGWGMDGVEWAGREDGLEGRMGRKGGCVWMGSRFV